MTFHIGQRVMAIFYSSESNARAFGIVVPQKYSIYTIRAFCLCSAKPALLLQEIRNTEIVQFEGTRLFGEPSFCKSHFRPLSDHVSYESLMREIEVET